MVVVWMLISAAQFACKWQNSPGRGVGILLMCLLEGKMVVQFGRMFDVM